MKHFHKYLSFALALALCLGLAACGADSTAPSDDSTDDNSYDVPNSFEGLVKDSEQMADLYIYGGAWTGEDNGTLLVANNEEGDEVRFALYDADEEITASGFIQTEPQYSADYFYNEHDGIAHRCSVPGDILEVDGFGEFTKVSGDKQGDDVGDGDYSALAGEWYQDYDGLVFAAEVQPDNYKDSAKRMQLDSIAPEAAIMDIPTLDPHGNLYFAICG